MFPSSRWRKRPLRVGWLYEGGRLRAHLLRLGGQVAIAVVLALLIAAVLYLLLGRRGTVSQFPTAAEVARLERDLAGDPGNPDRAFELAQAYLKQANTYRTFRSALASSRKWIDDYHLAEGNPQLAAKQETLEHHWQQLQVELGIRSDVDRDAVLQRAGRLVDQLQQCSDLPPPQRAAVHLLASGLHLERDDYPAAHAEIDAAARLDPASLPLHLLRADVFTAQERYAEAIEELRAANVKITAWAHRPPEWQLRLLAGLGGARGAARVERHWYRRRGEIASQLRHVIQTEIQLLRDLQRIGQLQARDAAPP